MVCFVFFCFVFKALLKKQYNIGKSIFFFFFFEEVLLCSAFFCLFFFCPDQAFRSSGKGGCHLEKQGGVETLRLCWGRMG